MPRPSLPVGRLLERKDTGVVAVAPDASVLDALRVMAERDIGAVVVLDEGRLVGMLSERDCARELVLAGRSARDTKVTEVMTAEVVTINPGETVEDCGALLMTRHHVRHLPVVEAGRVVGVISARDILAERVSEEGREIRDLETERLMIQTGSY
jgi:CBS domain-containing protein